MLAEIPYWIQEVKKEKEKKETEYQGKERRYRTLSRPVMAEKSKGLAGNPAPGGEASLLCSDCASPEDVSDLEFLFSAEPAFSSKQHKMYVRIVYQKS